MATPDPKQNDTAQLGVVIAVCATLIALVIVVYFLTKNDKNHFSHWIGVLGVAVPVLAAIIGGGAGHAVGKRNAKNKIKGDLGSLIGEALGAARAGHTVAPTQEQSAAFAAFAPETITVVPSGDLTDRLQDAQNYLRGL